MKYEVYDKAKWHYEAESMPKELPEIVGATHIAFFVRWCIENNLMSREFKEEFANELEQIKNKELDCRDFFFDCMDGVFTSDELNTKGKKFAAAYYHSEKTVFAKKYSYYLIDYENWTKIKFGSQYNPDTSYFYIENSEDNYKEIKEICDKRYSEFLEG
ncbi:DUF7832 domain-containing protein [Bacteroides cellulosilyticus]|uniref:DUF7832 domain-containing protein n=1 Tax=Bacteroides cellulosilyticus TaxID=246787 RepID=UPI0032EFDE47